MVNTEPIRTAVGIIGNVISLCLFLSPIPTFAKICIAKSVQEFKPDPYLATILNCLMWTFYGLPFVTKHNILVLTINGAGFVIEIFYIAIFFAFATWDKRKKILIVFAIEAIFSFLVIFCTLYFVHTLKERALIVGIVCIVLNVLMYVSPLTIMRIVIRTKSVKYMPFLLSLTNFANGVVWVIYAVFKMDIFIVVPNGLGAFSGLIQLILYCAYYKTTKWDDERSEVPMSNV